MSLPKLQLKTKANTKKKIQLKPQPNKYKMLDLFCGTGAFSYAFDQTGRVETVLANDFEPNSEKIFALNLGVPFLLKDLNDINVKDIPSHDIMSGGFPCQPFSVAGLQKGFSDSRSNVFWKILEILKHHKPKFFILENVKNLCSHDHGKTFTTIYDKLTEINYHIKYEILNTCKITNIPQNRERIYIVGFLNKNDYDRFTFDFPMQQNLNICDLLEKNVDASYYYGPRFKVWDEIEKNVTKDISTNTVYQYRRYYVRENKNKVCPTLTSNGGTGGHNLPLIKDSKGIRKLTPRECFNLQGFPLNYKLPQISDAGLYKLAGNAVSIPVVQLIANKLMQL